MNYHIESVFLGFSGKLYMIFRLHLRFGWLAVHLHRATDPIIGGSICIAVGMRLWRSRHQGANA